MGNKRRRASIVILAVVFSAVALFTVAYDVLKRFNVSSIEENVVNAASYTGRSHFTMDLSSVSTSGTALSFDNGIYMIYFCGGIGGGSSNYGMPGGNIAFYSGSSMTVKRKTGGSPAKSGNTDLGNSAGKASTSETLFYGTPAKGGDAVSVQSNFALPNSKTSGESWAAGGGGGYSWGSSSASAASGEQNAAFNIGSSASGAVLYGARASTTAKGKQGDGSTVSSNGGKLIYSYSGYGYGGVYYGLGSGGGAGLYDGGGGLYNKQLTSEPSKKLATGGAGSSSTNCYPICASNSTFCPSGAPYMATVHFYRLDPIDSQTPQNATYTFDGGGHTLNIPSGLNAASTTSSSSSFRYQPCAFGTSAMNSSGVLPSGNGPGAFGCWNPYSWKSYATNSSGTIESKELGYRTAWVYSTDNGSTWSTTPPYCETAGTTTTVKCKYVLYAKTGSTTISSSKYTPTYGMKYTDPTQAAKDSNYTIKEVTRTITINKRGTAAVNAPAPSGKRYNGYSQKLIETAGAVRGYIPTGSSTTTLVSGGTMYYKLTDSSGNVKVNWTTNPDDIQAKDWGDYKIYYYGTLAGCDSSSTSAYVDVSIAKFLGQTTISPPTGKTGLKYNAGNQVLVNAGSVTGYTKVEDGTQVTTTGTMTYQVTKPDGSTSGWVSATNATGDVPGKYTVAYKGSVTDCDPKTGSFEVTIGTGQLYISGGSVSLSNLSAYNGSGQTLLSSNSKTVAFNGTTTNYVSYRAATVNTHFTWSYTLQKKNASNAFVDVSGKTNQSSLDNVKPVDAGTYRVKIKAVSKDSAKYSDSTEFYTDEKTLSPYKLIIANDYISYNSAQSYNPNTSWSITSSNPFCSSNLATKGTDYEIRYYAYKWNGSSNSSFLSDVLLGSMKATDAGKYHIGYYAKALTANFSNSDRVEDNASNRYFEILKANLTAAQVTMPSANNRTFDTTSKALLTGTPSSTSGGTWSYKVTAYTPKQSGYAGVYVSSSQTKIADLTATSAGTYTVQCKIAATSNYNEYTQNVTVTIDQKQFVVTTKPQLYESTLTYDITDQLIIKTNGWGVIENGTIADADYTAKYQIYETNESTTVGSVKNSWSAVKTANAGDYKVKYMAEPKSTAYKNNYTASSWVWATGTNCSTDGVVHIEKNSTNPVRLPQGNNAYYNGNPQRLLATSASAVYENATVSYCDTEDGEYYTDYTLVTGVNAGDYWVWMKTSETANYKVTKIKFKYTISKATADGTEPTGITGLEYNGNEQPLIQAPGVLGEWTVTATGAKIKKGSKYYYAVDTIPSSDSGWTENWETLTAKTADTHKVYYYIAGDDNHNSTPKTAGSNVKCIQVPISSSNAWLTKQPTPNTGLEYNGDPKQLLSVAGEAKHGTVKYRIGNSGNWETSISATAMKKTDAGTYTVQYYIAADSGSGWSDGYYDNANQKPFSMTVTIAAYKATIATYPNPTRTFTVSYGSDGTIVTHKLLSDSTKGSVNLKFGSTTARMGSIQYKLRKQNDGVNGYITGKNWNTDINQMTVSNAGDYILDYKIVAADNDNNYLDSDPQSISITVYKGTPTVVAPIPNTVSVYDGTSKNLLVDNGSVGIGWKMQYRVPTKYTNGSPEWPTDGWTDLPSTLPANLKGTNAGNYYIQYRAAAISTDNCENSAIGTIIATIQKLQISVPAASAEDKLFNNGYQQLLSTIEAGVSADDGFIIYRILKKGTNNAYSAVIPHSNGTAVTNPSGATVDTAKRFNGSGVPTASGEWINNIDYIKVKDVADYTIEFKVITKSSNYSTSNLGTISASILSNQAAVVTAPVGKSGLSYVGSSIGLLSKVGVANAMGTMNYKVTGPSTNVGFTTDTSKIVGTYPGSYTITYYAKGKSTGYENSPESSFMVTIDQGQAEYGNNDTNKPAAPTATLAYNGTKLGLLGNAGTSNTSTGTLKYQLSKVGVSNAMVAFTNDSSKIVAELPNTYKVEYYIEGKTVGGYKCYYDTPVQFFTVTINKGSATSLITKPTAKAGTDLVYTTGNNGAAVQKALFNQGSLKTNTGGKTIGKLQYRIKGDANQGADADWFDDWGTGVYPDLLKRGLPGTYTVQYRFVSATDSGVRLYYDYHETDVSWFDVTIGAAAASISAGQEPKASAGTSLVYKDGAPIMLLQSGGVPVHGKMQYRVVNNAGEPIEMYQSIIDANGNVTGKGTDVISGANGWVSTATYNYKDITVNDPGYYTIEYYVQGDADYLDSGMGYISLTVAKAQLKAGTHYVAPQKINNLSFTGVAQNLITPGSFKSGYTGTFMYRMNDSSSFIEWDADSFKGIKATAYTISWYIQDVYGYENSYVQAITVTIGKTGGGINRGSLNGISGLIYNNADQQLFTGAASQVYLSTDTIKDEKATIYYAITQSNTVAPGDKDVVSTDISALTKTTAYNDSGNQIKYYLWYRADATASYNEVGWGCTGLYTTIGKATYSVSISKNNDVVYDGLPHKIYAGNQYVVSSNSGTDDTWVDVQTVLTYVGYNGATENLTPDNSVTNAGTYTLQFTCTPKAGKTYSKQIAGSTTSFVFKILQTDSISGITISGLTLTSSAINANGSAKPFNANQNINLSVFNNNQYNGITSNNYVNNNVEYNQLGYLFTQESDESALGSFNDCTTASSLNTAIKNLSTSTAGTWYLWFSVLSHNSLQNGVIFKAATINVTRYDATNVTMKGLTITGSTSADIKNGSSVYKGSSYKIVKSGATVSFDQSLIYSGVKYAINSDGTTAPTVDNDWKSTVAELPTKTDVGTYYLWIKWNQSDNLTETTGRVYGSFKITQLTDFTNYYFTGLSFEPQTSSTTADGYKTYSLTFSNTNQKVIKASSTPTVKVNSSSTDTTTTINNLTTSFAASNAFKIGVCNNQTTMTGTYYTLANYSSLVVKNVDTYYLWISWSGSANVAAGSKIYQIDNNTYQNNAVVGTKISFQVKKNSDASSLVSLTNQSKVAKYYGGVSQHQYQYTFTDIEFKGVQQQLFEADETPVVQINGVNYSSSTTFKYLLTKDDNETTVAATTGGWQNTIAAAKVTDIGVYHLWLKITINNTTSVYAVKYYDLGSAEIIPTTSFVQIPPKQITGLVTDTQTAHQLITKSTQTKPAVEYWLEGVSTSWTENATSLTRVAAGTYRIYYRGATYTENGVTIFNALTLEANQTNYPYVEVSISQTNASIKTMPSKKNNVYYTGHAISNDDLFNQGSAQYENQTTHQMTEINLLYSWEDTQNSFVPYANLTKKTAAGSYHLYFKPDTRNMGDNVGPIDSATVFITVEIKKVEVENSNLVTEENDNLIYTASEYQVFLNEMDYSLYYEVNGNKIYLKESNGTTKIKYTNHKSDTTYGALGVIKYGVSTNPEIEPAPSEWKTNYSDVTIRQVGTYYPWIKVEAGDNHNALNPVCFELNTITIKPADANSISLKKTTYSGQTYHYNSLERQMISDFNLVVEVQKRDANGNVVSGYNPMENDRKGNVYYALNDSSTNSPDPSNKSLNGWHTSWETLTKSKYGTYYLWIMFEDDGGSNFETIRQCLTTYATNDGSTRDAIKIEKAEYSELSVSGITGLSVMFNGANQGYNDGLIAGELKVSIGGYDVTDEIDIGNVKYCFKTTTESAPLATDDCWKAILSAKALAVGNYQLYVKLALKSGNNYQNIDGTIPLIYAMFVAPNYAEIYRVDERYLDVIAPEFYDLTYNGKNQRIIKTGATVRLKNGNQLVGDMGRAYYYISGSPDVRTQTGTTSDNTWHYTITGSNLVQLHAGTYYIWLKFNQGTSHTALEPRYIGSVTIAQADPQSELRKTTLSGMTFTSSTYNGAEHTLVGKTNDNYNIVVQKFSNGYTLNSTNDYSKIEYGYSSDPSIAPAEWVDENNLDALKARNAGNYYIWVKVTGKPNPKNGQYNIADYMRCYAIDNPNEKAVITKAILTKSYFYGINTHSGLSYIGKNQVLADLTPNTEGKLTIKINTSVGDVNMETYNPNIVVRWGLGTGSATNAGPTNANAWVTDLSRITGKNAIDYYLWVKVTGSDNIEDFTGYYAKISIAKAQIAYLVKPQYYGDGINPQLTYNCAEQSLLVREPVAYFAPTTTTYYTDPDEVVSGKPYYLASEVQYQYQVNNGNSISNYINVKGIDAGILNQVSNTYIGTRYRVSYNVVAGNNWNQKSEYVDVYIAPIDASDYNFGLINNPNPVTGIVYDENEHELITYGHLAIMDNDRGTANEGAKIAFWYTDQPNNKYYYYYNKTSGNYVWENGKLPGRTDHGTYYIQYQIIAGTNNHNYYDSAIYGLEINIAQRQIKWHVNPRPIYGLKYNNHMQVAVEAGYFNHEINDNSVKVYYSKQKPYTENREWSIELPQVDKTGVWDIYYYVDFDADNKHNNVFIGPENNDPAVGELLQVLVERHVLSIRTAPESTYMEYTAEYQNLIYYYSLSTDYASVFDPEDMPYFEYSFDRNVWNDYNIMAKDCGNYLIYYRLHYNDDIFDFLGKIPMSGEINAVIYTKYIVQGLVTAAYDLNTKTVSMAADGYSTALQNEFSQYAKFQYRIYDEYNLNRTWEDWQQDGQQLPMGTYQFRIIVEDKINPTPNFNPYTQTESYQIVEIKEDRKVFIVMPNNTYSTLAYVRAWIDFTGTMTYEKAPTQYRYEGWANTNGDKLFCTFKDLSTTGVKGKAVLRVQTLNNAYYFRTADELNQETRRKTLVKWNEEKDTYYKGLPTADLRVYLYEVYHIQYSGNGAVPMTGTVAPDESWKWHGIDYLLEENIYRKETTDTHELLTPNGWNTARAGNGNNYPSGSYYRGNSSQIFYADFFKSDVVKYKINWIIMNDTDVYSIALKTGKWFNANNDRSRETGVYVEKDAPILLPQIVEDEDHNQFWTGTLFNNYRIKGWFTTDDDWTIDDGIINNPYWKNIEYYFNMKATSNMTFVAVLEETTDDVQCVFQDQQGKQISASGIVANGAKSYLALSGMDTATYTTYQDGYQEWMQTYGQSALNATPDDAITFTLQTNSTPEKPTENSETTKNSFQEYVTMFVILGVGLLMTVASLVVYLPMRKKLYTIK